MLPNGAEAKRSVLDDILKRHRETDVSLYTTSHITITTTTNNNNSINDNNPSDERKKQSGALRFSDGYKSIPPPPPPAAAGGRGGGDAHREGKENEGTSSTTSAHPPSGRDGKKSKVEALPSLSPFSVASLPPPTTTTTTIATVSTKAHTTILNSNATRNAETVQFAMPYTPYTVQEEMIQFIKTNLECTNAANRAPTTTTSTTTATAAAASSSTNAVPIAAAEVPTGCGKTLTLLYTVLQFQHKVNKEIQSDKDAKAYIKARQYNWDAYNRTHLYHNNNLNHDSNGSLDEDGKALKEYTLPPSFFKQFRVQSNKKLKVEVDNDSGEGATELRKSFERPRMTVFYLSRTHAQLKQVVGELKKLIYYNVRTNRNNNNNNNNNKSATNSDVAPAWRADSMCRVRMNILAGRDRLCIHPLVVRHGQQSAQGHQQHRHQQQQQQQQQAPPSSRAGLQQESQLLVHENNNLGEVCDKLVSLGKCPCVEGYGDLAAKTLVGPIGTARHNRSSSSSSSCRASAGASTTLFDLEDLVLEGVGCQCCPYYAARDLAFFADINFCTYNYLFDPMIRHESKMESILKPDNCILIVDEAHNLPSLCSDVLSTEFPVELFALLEMEVLPLCLCHPLCAAMAGPNAAQRRGAESRTYLSYGRDFKLTHFTLVELFLFLYVLLQRVHRFFSEEVPWLVEEELPSHSSSSSSDTKGMALGQALCTYLVPTLKSIASQCGGSAAASSSSSSSSTNQAKKKPQRSSGYTWQSMFREVYSVVMCLGVTFNPFQFSIFALSMLKKLLFIIRYVLLRPDAFVCCAKNMNTMVSRGAPALQHQQQQQQQQEQELDHDREVRGIRAAMENIPSYTDTLSTMPMAAAPAAAAAAAAAPPISGEHAPKRRCALRCVDPSLAFHYIVQQTYRTILVSGTLSPIDQMERSLGLFAHHSGRAGAVLSGQKAVDPCWKYFIGRHVVPNQHFRVCALTHMHPEGSGPTGSLVPLRCTYQFLRDDAFKGSLAKTILTICQQSFARTSATASPSSAAPLRRGGSGAVGVLCFVPNYALLRDLYHRCHALLRGGHPNPAVDITLMQEPHASAELQHTFAQFRQLILGSAATSSFSCSASADMVAPSGKKRVVLFFCVYRGKLSEGLDFTDSMARLVLCVGLPLSPLKDYKVVAQKQFYARQQQQQWQQRGSGGAGSTASTNSTADGGEVWYVNDAMMAVNQSLGRCLRHAADYGALLLLDERYDNSTHTNGSHSNQLAGKLSQWCRNELRSYRATEDLAVQLRRFFSEMEADPANRAAATTTTTAEEEAMDALLENVAGDETAPYATVTATTSSPLHLGTVQLPFRKTVPPPSASRPFHGHTTAEKPMQRGRLPPPPTAAVPSLSAHRHSHKDRFKYAALKLLYESVEDTKLCTAEQLKERMESMEREFI